MTTYNSQSVAWDDLFDFDIIGDGPQAVGYAANSVPMKYAALAYGTKRADIGYAINGVDVSNLWAMKGSATYVSSTAVPSSLTIYQNSTTGPVTATVAFAYGRNGTTSYFDSGSGANVWNTPTGSTVGDAFDIRFTQVAGNTSGTLTATLNTWLQINATRSVTLAVTKTGAGSVTARRTIQVEIRRRSDGIVLATQTVYMEAEADIN